MPRYRITRGRDSAAAAPRRRARPSTCALPARSAIVRATFSTRSELRALSCQRSAARFSSARCSGPSFTTRHSPRASSRAFNRPPRVELHGRAPRSRPRAPRGLAGRRGLRDIVERHARHVDVQVEPVEQRPRDPPGVLLEPARRALAAIGAVAAIAARTRIHRGDELELRRKRDLLVHARDARDAALERLAQRLERVRDRTRAARPGTARRDARARSRRAAAACRRRRAPRPSSCGAARETAATASGPRRAARPRRTRCSRRAACRRTPAAAAGRASRSASMLLPLPGGPIIRRLWPPAAATVSARFANAWPRTSARSGGARRAETARRGATRGSGCARRRDAARPP